VQARVDRSLLYLRKPGDLLGGQRQPGLRIAGGRHDREVGSQCRPGYGGEAACSPLVTNSCPTNTLTEAFGGTSESAGLAELAVLHRRAAWPAGDERVVKTADANADNPYTYELWSPSGKEVVADATPTTTLQGVGSTTPTALANLSVANPAAGRWLIVVQLNLTTSGQEFSQVVNGDVTFNNSGVTVLSGLPTAPTTTIPQEATHQVQLLDPLTADE
jgi:hypothetical protein